MRGPRREIAWYYPQRSPGITVRPTSGGAGTTGIGAGTGSRYRHRYRYRLVVVVPVILIAPGTLLSNLICSDSSGWPSEGRRPCIFHMLPQFLPVPLQGSGVRKATGWSAALPRR